MSRLLEDVTKIVLNEFFLLLSLPVQLPAAPMFSKDDANVQEKVQVLQLEPSKSIHIKTGTQANPKEVWAERGARKPMGENLKVVWVEFSFLS